VWAVEQVSGNRWVDAIKVVGGSEEFVLGFVRFGIGFLRTLSGPAFGC
jgi:hypothetical protein